MPVVNWVLFIGVIARVLLFSSPARLANAYGLAVTGTLVLVSVLFIFYAATVWRWAWWKILSYVAVIGALEVLLFAANTTKFLAGGWLALVMSTVVVLLMTT